MADRKIFSPPRGRGGQGLERRLVDGGSWMVDRGLWIVDCGLWIVDCGLWIVDCGLWIVDRGLWIVDGGWWIFFEAGGFASCSRRLSEAIRRFAARELEEDGWKKVGTYKTPRKRSCGGGGSA
jgi:hypothetical protein